MADRMKKKAPTAKNKFGNKPEEEKLVDSIGRRKLFKLGVGMGVAALPYVIPTIYTFTVPKNAFACHMGISHGRTGCG
jgi:hypothetical protein